LYIFAVVSHGFDFVFSVLGSREGWEQRLQNNLPVLYVDW